jgi:hypothetical protein
MDDYRSTFVIKETMRDVDLMLPVCCVEHSGTSAEAEQRDLDHRERNADGRRHNAREKAERWYSERRFIKRESYRRGENRVSTA